MPKPRLRAALVWGGLAVSLGFTYLAVRDIDVAVFWNGIRESELWWVAPSFAALCLTVYLRGLRWRLLFAPRTRPPMRAVMIALLIGYLFNNILPARAGEAARVVALKQQAGTSRAEAVGTAVTERVFDVLAVLVLLFVSLPFLPQVTWVRTAAVLGIVLFAGLLAAIAVLALYGERPARFALRPLARLPGLSVEQTDRAAANLVHGLAGFRDLRLALPAFLLTAVSWLVLALSFWLLMLGFDLGVGYEAGLLVVVATSLAMIIPSSPAAVGVFEAATQVALGAWGIGDSEALSYAVVLHVVNFLPSVVVGYVVLHRHAATLRVRSRQSESADPGTPAADAERP